MLVIEGRKVEVPGVEGTSFLDNPRVAMSDKRDSAPRAIDWVRNITIHSRLGIHPQKIDPNPRDRRWDELVGARVSGDSRTASWHVSVDADGSFACHLDVKAVKAYHAGQCNLYSVGIEMYQTSDGTITLPTLETTVKIVDVLTRELGIQRQCVARDERAILKRFARRNRGRTRSQELAYAPGGRSGADFVGVFGHRNATRNRGPGDPGDAIWELFEKAGYEFFSASAEQDLEVWQERQIGLGLDELADGIPGPITVAAIKNRAAVDEATAACGSDGFRLPYNLGVKHGLWVGRPGD